LILNKFSLHFQNLLEPKDPTPYDVISIIHGASFLKNQPTGFSKFISAFTYQVYLLIYEEKFPRILQELQDCLHPTTENHIGDWFLFKNYIVITVYGLEEKPYRLPIFLTPRIFALEVLRKRFHSYLVHFASRNQASSFKVPITLGPFTVKNKSTIELIDDIMACFCFQEDPSCQYDPHHIISNRRKKQKRSRYDHKGTIEMEQMVNKLTF
jgi:hypothetical protein